ncbi:MAG: PhzF family phenazine biosynthesis protein [Caldilineaceae bacterium]|nr:PhzF family phenazine biosynthesis protein [Caldilineaceae bacterium]
MTEEAVVEKHIFQVDAFTKERFGGNPAAVCILEEAADEDWMQAVAAEMNLAETAFLVRENDGFRLRWFTPTVEVELCGHATLAGAHVLWEAGYLWGEEEARFYTLSGLLTANTHDGWIELNFPAVLAEEVAADAELLAALGISAPIYVGRNKFDYLIEVESASEVRGLAPNFAKLSEAGGRGVMVTARDEAGEFDFVSRFFAPAAGINEDPVTGSAHCALCPYWAAKLDKVELRAFQASPRGGIVNLVVAGDRVLLRGQAVTVLRGMLV